jgi:hypothetical protein
MRKLGFLVVLLAIIALVGVKRGWFQLGTDRDGDTTKMTVTVDQSKIHDDEAKAAAKVHDATAKVAEATGQHAR